MFSGSSYCNIDNKSRITIPVIFRKYIKPEAKNKFFIARGLRTNLNLYPADEWEKILISLQVLNTLDEVQGEFLRDFLMYAFEVELDVQNRILIPHQLIEYAKLKREVFMIGFMKKIELWDVNEWKNYRAKRKRKFADNAKVVSPIIGTNFI